MDGDALYQRLAAMRDELDEILRTIEFPSEGADDFEVPDGGEFIVDETSVQIDDLTVPKKSCNVGQYHASHFWFEGDNVAPWDCPGIGPEHPHQQCENLSMHDGHIWTSDGITVWCPGMPF